MRFFNFLFFLAAFTSLAQAQPIVITDADLVADGTYNWTSDNEYHLDGIVVLEAGGTLNIEAGTVVKGLAVPTTGDLGSALVIARDAQIFATGTADEPVVFTSEFDDLTLDDDLEMQDRGLWGGIIICGNAPIAVPDSVQAEIVEGFEDLYFGGTDEEDHSGELRYLSIRHAGAAVSPVTELNGLTLCGLGRGTTISNIEVYASRDDGIAINGGTVDLRYLSVSFCTDDFIDWDYGWRGRGQFWLVVQDVNSDRCAEHDGGIPDLAEPFSRPVISNVTYIGPGQNLPDAPEEMLLFRDRSGGVYTNSIFINFPGYALDVEDRTDITDSYDHLATNDLKFMCNYWSEFGAGDTWPELVKTLPEYEDPSATALIDHLESNTNLLADPMLTNIAPDPDLFDPRPTEMSPAMSAACPVGDPFFETVSYVGAFGSEPDDIWLREWSGMAANRFFSNIVSSSEDLAVPAEAVKLYPNPANTLVTLAVPAELSLPLEYTLQNAAGQTLRRGWLRENQMEMNVRDLPQGLYHLQLRTGNGQLTKKLAIFR